MVISPFIFLLLIGSVAGLATVIFFLISSYNHMLKKIEQAESHAEHHTSELSDQTGSLLRQAHLGNVKIIQDTFSKAAAIIAASKGDEKQAAIIKKKLDELTLDQQKTLEKMTSDFRLLYEQTLKKLGSEDAAHLSEMTKQLQDQVDQTLGEFTHALKEETVGTQKIMQEKTESEYAKIEKELQDFKNAQMKKISDASYPLLKEVTRIVLGKSLKLDDHEELIVKALDEAKGQLQTAKN